MLALLISLTGIASCSRNQQDHASEMKSAKSEPKTELLCRFRLAGIEEQRRLLEKAYIYDGHPERLTEKSLRNPLIADVIHVEVTCVSGPGGAYFGCGSGKPFWAMVAIEDSKGNTVQFPEHSMKESIRRTPPIPEIPGYADYERLGPGQVVTLRAGLWNSPKFQNAPAPGIYRARVVCFFYREGEEGEQRLESEPMSFEITEQHIKDYSATLAYLE